VIFWRFLAAKEWITTKWMEIDNDYLRTGTAIGFRASRELCSNYLLFLWPVVQYRTRILVAVQVLQWVICEQFWAGYHYTNTVQCPFDQVDAAPVLREWNNLLTGLQATEKRLGVADCGNVCWLWTQRLWWWFVPRLWCVRLTIRIPQRVVGAVSGPRVTRRERVKQVRNYNFLEASFLHVCSQNHPDAKLMTK